MMIATENQLLYRPAVEALVGKELLVAAVRSLHDPQTCASGSNLLLIIIRDIFLNLPRSPWYAWDPWVGRARKDAMLMTTTTTTMVLLTLSLLRIQAEPGDAGDAGVEGILLADVRTQVPKAFF